MSSLKVGSPTSGFMPGLVVEATARFSQAGSGRRKSGLAIENQG